LYVFEGKMRYLNIILTTFIFFLVGCGAIEKKSDSSSEGSSYEDRLKAKEDKQHVFMWNLFAENLLSLHQNQIKKQRVQLKKKEGGYASNKNFYTEIEYTSVKTGKLISRVQWEKARPNVMHSIEVYLYDSKGRVVRDFLAAYLPGHRNAPVQTLITLHQYKDKLHGFRSFDASGDKVLERCEGEFLGKSFEFLLDVDDMYSAYLNGNPIEPKAYEACLGKTPEKAGKYLRPH